MLGVLAGTIGTGAGTVVTGRIGGFTTTEVAWVPQHPVMVASTVLEEVRLYLGVPGFGPDAAAAGRPDDVPDGTPDGTLAPPAARPAMLRHGGASRPWPRSTWQPSTRPS